MKNDCIFLHNRMKQGETEHNYKIKSSCFVSPFFIFQNINNLSKQQEV